MRCPEEVGRVHSSIDVLIISLKGTETETSIQETWRERISRWKCKGVPERLWVQGLGGWLWQGNHPTLSSQQQAALPPTLTAQSDVTRPKTLPPQNEPSSWVHPVKGMDCCAAKSHGKHHGKVGCSPISSARRWWCKPMKRGYQSDRMSFLLWKLLIFFFHLT